MVCTWGQGEDGQLGHPENDDVHTPKEVVKLCLAGISLVVCGGAKSYHARQDQLFKVVCLEIQVLMG